MAISNSDTGTRLFQPISNFVGITNDQGNFIICMIASLCIAPMYRTTLHPSKVSAQTRHLFGLILGVIFAYACFGFQMIHIVTVPALAYAIIVTQKNNTYMPQAVLIVSMVYLSCVHIFRLVYDYSGYTIDVSGPLMIIIQKVSALAFSIQDVNRKPDELTKLQKYHLVNDVPSIFEFYCFIFHHQTLLAGPIVFYNDYIEFIRGEQYSSVQKTGGKFVEPSPTKVVIQKVAASVACVLVYLRLNPVYPIETIRDAHFLAHSLFYKFWYLQVVTTLARFKYYHAWLLGDAICNQAGLGFNGVDDNGNMLWNKISNIDFVGFEFAVNFRGCVDSWNIGTTQWLRMVIYERTGRNRTFLTYMCSALWHGFYPGYYITFANGALATLAARAMRRALLEYFVDNKAKKIIYDLITFLTTRVIMCYVTFPFVNMELASTLKVYWSIFMCVHILFFVAIIAVPKIMIRRTKLNEKPKNAQGKLESKI